MNVTPPETPFSFYVKKHLYCQPLCNMAQLTSPLNEMHTFNSSSSQNLPIPQSLFVTPSRAASAITPSVCTLSNPAKDFFWDAAHILKNDRNAKRQRTILPHHIWVVCYQCSLLQAYGHVQYERAEGKPRFYTRNVRRTFERNLFANVCDCMDRFRMKTVM